jgi:Flp pilus assembly protein TadG
MLKKREDGAAAVEFALVFTLLMTIVFGIIQFGKLYGEYEALVSAAREGGRVAAVQGTTVAVKNEVVAAAAPYTIICAAGTGATCVQLAPGPGGATGTSCNNTNSGTNVTVSWDQRFTLSFPLVPPFNRTVHIQAVFRCE